MTHTINTGVGDTETLTTTVTGTALPSTPSSYGVTFGTYSVDTGGPGAFRTPDAVSVSPDGKTATLSLIVGPSNYNPVAGRYWIWRRDPNGDVSVDPSVIYQIVTGSGQSIGSAVPPLVVTDNLDGTFSLGAVS